MTPDSAMLTIGQDLTKLRKYELWFGFEDVMLPNYATSANKSAFAVAT